MQIGAKRRNALRQISVYRHQRMRHRAASRWLAAPDGLAYEAKATPGAYLFTGLASPENDGVAGD